ncbi:hypothetical protein [Amycolatopsis sp. MEPSY49]|uniref:hypothetical protein n=1 Tax=Amycolatopsis sp. MEPSY49 TaxID=3151600 RepID=UPI003EF11845
MHGPAQGAFAELGTWGVCGCWLSKPADQVSAAMVRTAAARPSIPRHRVSPSELISSLTGFDGCLQREPARQRLTAAEARSDVEPDARRREFPVLRTREIELGHGDQIDVRAPVVLW